MTDLTKIYIDLSKCSEVQIQKIENIIKYKIDEIECYPLLIYLCDVWNQCKKNLNQRTELTYPEFIKLFEGGEETEVQKLKKQIGLYKECFELFIPTDKWDEANEFLSINNNPLGKHLSKVQRGLEKKPKF